MVKLPTTKTKLQSCQQQNTDEAKNDKSNNKTLGCKPAGQSASKHRKPCPPKTKKRTRRESNTQVTRKQHESGRFKRLRLASCRRTPKRGRCGSSRRSLRPGWSWQRPGLTWRSTRTTGQGHSQGLGKVFLKEKTLLSPRDLASQYLTPGARQYGCRWAVVALERCPVCWHNPWLWPGWWPEAAQDHSH